MLDDILDVQSPDHTQKFIHETKAPPIVTKITLRDSSSKFGVVMLQLPSISVPWINHDCFEGPLLAAYLLASFIS